MSDIHHSHGSSKKLPEDPVETPSCPQWQRIGIGPHHGLAVPLFSLHSSSSEGIGDYLDLLPLITWCQSVGFDLIQLLPLNDTGHESSPYSALSAFALHPIYLKLSALPHWNEDRELASALLPLQVLSKQLPRVDYPAITLAKEELLRRYLSRHGEKIAHSLPYIRFCQESPWLEDYALYKALKEKQNWLPWEAWEKDLQTPTPSYKSQLLLEHRSQMFFHSAVQYLCYQQFSEVRKHAEECGVLLKGDLPILINRDSADVWQQSSLFDLDHCAGAPPDMYAPEGQNWGIPLHRWQEHERRHFLWWRQRLAAASSLFHLYRIDHVVGFFRIWAIPPNRSGKEGHFQPSSQERWIPEGKKRLQMMLESSPMLPIGEDLGCVPPSIRHCLTQLGICGTKVLRWERNWQGDGCFVDPAQFSPISMSCLSTHDSEPLRLWWEKDPSSQLLCRQKGWHWQPKATPTQLVALLEGNHGSRSLFHIDLLCDYLAPFPELCPKDPAEERINTPGTISTLNWSVRLLPSVEEITDHGPLRELMHRLAHAKTTPFYP